LVCCLAKCFGSGRIDGSETGSHSYTKNGLSVLVIRGIASFVYQHYQAYVIKCTNSAQQKNQISSSSCVCFGGGHLISNWGITVTKVTKHFNLQLTLTGVGVQQNRFLMASGGGYFAQSLLRPTYRRLLKMN
jgi:hypothetical protein